MKYVPRHVIWLVELKPVEHFNACTYISDAHCVEFRLLLVVIGKKDKRHVYVRLEQGGVISQSSCFDGCFPSHATTIQKWWSVYGRPHDF